MTEHLVIRAPNWVGDLAMATPILRAAVESERWPRVQIILRKHLTGVLADGPLADAVVPVASSKDELATLRRLAPDAILLLSNSFGSALRAWRAGVPIRAGSALSGRRWLLTHSVVPPSAGGRRAPVPTPHLMRDAAGLVGIWPRALVPQLDVGADKISEQRARLEALGLGVGEPFSVCCPGAAFGSAKSWRPEFFARVLDRLYEQHGWRPVVTGGPGEEPLVEAVVSCAESPAISLSKEPRDLERLKGLLAQASFLLVSDSGPRYMAEAFGVPCVTLVGPNFIEVTARISETCELVRRPGLECAPCLERTCPLGHHRCMTELTPDLVLAAAQRVLQRCAGARLREEAHA
ncbi:MAG: heptosyltransferase-2 [Chlamydiales bacterium]|jgi:heptosyltransferase-2